MAPQTAAEPRVPVARVRRDAVLGAGPAAAVLCYLFLTVGEPHRLVMIAVTVPALAGCLLMLRLPDLVARHRFAGAVSPVLAASFIVSSAVLALLDGGVAGPLGLLPYVGLAVTGIAAPGGRFVGYAALTLAAYSLVAWYGDPAPAGHTVTVTSGCMLVAVLCAVHSRALRSLDQRLANVASLDPLTGCLNRGAFDDRFEEEAARAARAGESLVLVVFDLDDFKAVNDTLGHAAGDGVLTWTAQVLTSGVRAHDSVGRVGGDEFAVLLTDASDEPAEAMAGRLRTLLETHAPASIGYARFPEDGRDTDTLRRTADQRLYADKARRGRRTGVPLGDPPAAPALPLLRPPQVQSTERRRQSIEQAGMLSVGSFSIGALYALVFADPAVARLLVGLVCLGWGIGLLTAALAGAVARSRAVKHLMYGFAAVQVALAATLTAVDGGITSPTSVGLLNVMPLVALTSPRRLAGPVVGSLAVVYVGIAVLVGSPGGWVVVVNLCAFLGISVVCAMHGRLAAKQRDRLVVLSRSDALTGCLNRRGFEERLAAALSRAQRTGTPLSLLVLDLDDFKTVNDTQGHAAGDELLRWVGHHVVTHLRAGDSAGRMGGDEFAVLLPGCTREEAAQVARRLLAGLAERTSASVGAATLGVDGDDPESLHLRADEALYEHKRAQTPPRTIDLTDPVNNHEAGRT